MSLNGVLQVLSRAHNFIMLPFQGNASKEVVFDGGNADLRGCWGKEVAVFVELEVIEDPGCLPGNDSDEAYLETLEKHRGEVPDGVGKAIVQDSNFDKKGRLFARAKDIASLAHAGC